MVVFTGDLSPRASGSASLGVDMSNGMGGFTTDIRPYAHMHMNSGVWHDQSGQSGVLRYSRAAGGFEISIDGGATFSLVASASPIDLDDAYEIGNEINQNQRALPPGLSPMVIGQVPVLIKHATPGAGNSNGARSLEQGREDAGIIASGFSITPNVPNSFAYGALGPGFLHLQASGTQSTAPVSFVIGLGNVGSVLDNLGIFSTDAVMQWNVRGITISTDAGEADGDVAVNTGNASNGLGGQITLNPFAGSGQLNYNFGPYQSWYIKTSDDGTGGPFGNGEWPIAHSGQVAEMIIRAGGSAQSLQAAYDGGNQINHRRDLIGYKGAVVRETIPGGGISFVSNADITTNKSGKYGLAVSGFTLTPNTPNSYAIAVLNSDSLTFASSGSVSVLSRNMFMGYPIGLPDPFTVSTNGSLRIVAGDLTGTGRGGQIQLQAFGASGSLEYRFGPHQAWAARLTHSSTGGPANDGFWPIPHSGQVLEMIARTPKSKAITIERPAVNQDLTIWYTNEAIVITEIESILRGSFDASGQFAIRFGSDRSQVGTSVTTLPITCTNRTTGQITTSFASASIPADNWVWIGVSGVSGVSTAQLNVTLQYLN